MKRYRILKIEYRLEATELDKIVAGEIGRTEYWLERQKRFLWLTWWSRTTHTSFANECDTIRHLHSLCESCAIDYKHIWHKENCL